MYKCKYILSIIMFVFRNKYNNIDTILRNQVNIIKYFLKADITSSTELTTNIITIIFNSIFPEKQ